MREEGVAGRLPSALGTVKMSDATRKTAREELIDAVDSLLPFELTKRAVAARRERAARIVDAIDRYLEERLDELRGGP